MIRTNILKLALILAFVSLNATEMVQVPKEPEVVENPAAKILKGAAFITLSYQLGRILASFSENDPEIMRIPGALISGIAMYDAINNSEKSQANKTLALVSGVCVTSLNLKMDCYISPESHFAKLLTGIESSLILIKLKNYVTTVLKDQDNKYINRLLN